MTRVTTLKALRPALRQIGLDCWTCVAGGGGGYTIGTPGGLHLDGQARELHRCGPLSEALRVGNRLLREATNT